MSKAVGHGGDRLLPARVERFWVSAVTCLFADHETIKGDSASTIEVVRPPAGLFVVSRRPRIEPSACPRRAPSTRSGRLPRAPADCFDRDHWLGRRAKAHRSERPHRMRKIPDLQNLPDDDHLAGMFHARRFELVNTAERRHTHRLQSGRLPARAGTSAVGASEGTVEVTPATTRNPQRRWKRLTSAAQ